MNDTRQTGLPIRTPYLRFAIPCLLLGTATQLATAAAASLPEKAAPNIVESSDTKVRVAGIVLKWLRTDKEANCRRAEKLIRRAAEGGAQIVCTTECFLDGYAIKDKTMPLEDYRALGEPIPSGTYYDRLAALADKLDIFLVAGMLEADGERRYNTAVLIDPHGKLVGKYRKHKLEHELVRNTAGDSSPVFETPYGKVGIMICADRRFPEVVKPLCDAGAELLICPSGGMFGSKVNDPILQTRSKENGKWILFVHPAEFLVTDPQGKIRSRTILGDRLEITPEQVGREHDKNEVFFFDLPLIRQNADLVLRGGRIVTLDEKVPAAEAIAVRDGRIAAVGSVDQISGWIGDDTRVIDLEGRLTIPGFIDSHGHFLSLGRAKRTIDLSRATSYAQVIRLVRQSADKAPAGRWITGRGWHQAKWAPPPEPSVEGYPTHAALSRATPNHPVVLTHASGHMALANALAMRRAGVGKGTRDPSGGEILRDPAGHPTGVFREDAAGLIYAVQGRAGSIELHGPARDEFEEAVQMATKECLAHGVTSFQDAGSSLATIDRLQRLAEDGRLQVRLWVMIGESNAVLARRLPQYRMIDVGNHHLTVRAIKRFMDGALGTHGAWLLEPYEDLPRSRGLNSTSLTAIRQTARLAMDHNFQLCVHAIGDRANRETLNVFEEVFQDNPDTTNLRWRIEHAQHLHPSDIPRFAQLGVIASMQAVHCTSDAPFVIERLGRERAGQGAYAWRSLIDSGAVISNGTDTPVERVDPIVCFHAAVTRKPRDRQPFFPEQRMTRMEALRSYTLNPAYAAFEDHLKGSLSPGKLADIVVLSHDILTVPEDQILDARVMHTIVGGRVLYECSND